MNDTRCKSVIKKIKFYSGKYLATHVYVNLTKKQCFPRGTVRRLTDVGILSSACTILLISDVTFSPFSWHSCPRLWWNNDLWRTTGTYRLVQLSANGSIIRLWDVEVLFWWLLIRIRDFRYRFILGIVCLNQFLGARFDDHYLDQAWVVHQGALQFHSKMGRNSISSKWS